MPSGSFPNITGNDTPLHGLDSEDVERLVARQRQYLSLPVDRSYNQPARSRIRLVFGNTSVEAELEITPLGLAAVGGMVGMILLAIAPMVKSAASTNRR